MYPVTRYDHMPLPHRDLGTDRGRPSPLLFQDLGCLRFTMPQLRDFLAHLRPAGAPGAAARTGGPAERSRELEAEVGPVLALLEGAAAEREQIIAQARREAEEITAAARAEAAAIAADADRRARAARAEAARQAIALAREETARSVDSALRQAVRTRELAGRRMPALVSHTVDAIRQLEAVDT